MLLIFANVNNIEQSNLLTILKFNFVTYNICFYLSSTVEFFSLTFPSFNLTQGLFLSNLSVQNKIHTLFFSKTIFLFSDVEWTSPLHRPELRESTSKSLLDPVNLRFLMMEVPYWTSTLDPTKRATRSISPA